MTSLVSMCPGGAVLGLGPECRLPPGSGRDGSGADGAGAMTRGRAFARIGRGRAPRWRAPDLDPTRSGWCLSLALLSTRTSRRLRRVTGDPRTIRARFGGAEARVAAFALRTRHRHRTMRTWTRRRSRSSSSALLLLVAALAGWLARRLGLPAIVGYLAVGLLVSPFTPGYVADHEQLQLLADVGVVLLLFEVGIEVDVARLRREHGHAPVGRAAPDRSSRRRSRPAARSLAAGLAAVRGRAPRARRRAVVERRHRQHHAEPAPDDDARDRAACSLGWSVLQDITGVALAVVLLAVFGSAARPPLEAFAGLAVFAVLRSSRGLAPPAGAPPAPPASTTCSCIVSVATGLALAGAGRGHRRRSRSRWRRSSPAWRSARAPTRRRRAAGCCRSATCSRCCSSSRSGRSSTPRRSRPRLPLARR